MAIEINVPRLGWSMEEGTFAGWVKKDGDTVKAGEPIFTLEGEKSLEEVESLDSGILRIPADAPKPGEKVLVGQRLGYLLAAGEAMPTGATAPGTATAAAENEASPVPGGGNRKVFEADPKALRLPLRTGAAADGPPDPKRLGVPPPSETADIPVTPRARRAAAQLGVDLSRLQGSGRGGRIRERDVRAATPAASAAPAPAGLPAGSTVAVTGLRRVIADRMMRSGAQTAPVTLTCRADATQLASLRRQFQTAGGTAPAPTYTDIAAKLCAIALQRHPMLAARWEGEGIVLAKSIDIGIAVDTEDGLLVPVIRNVPALSLPKLVQASRELVEGARARRLKADQLKGGVFTITNLGGFGVEAFTPIINFPEAAILGLGAIRPEPVVLEDGRVVGREQITLSLTFDHRVVDGAPAARFLQTLREGIENPGAWLLAGT